VDFSSSLFSGMGTFRKCVTESGAFASKSATELDSDLFDMVLDAIVSFAVRKNALVNFRIKLNPRGAIGTRMRAGRKDTSAKYF